MNDVKQIDAGVLNVAYVDVGPADGPAVLLLHGWPYDIRSFDEVVPLLTDAGCRVIVPYLRGYGTTRSSRTERFATASRRRSRAMPSICSTRSGSSMRRSPASTGERAPHPDPSAYAGKFSGTYSHRTIEGGVGHNLPQEAPAAFADAVLAAGGGGE
jgi:pimeloyl-ACP methyl ester carboxylesterase